MQDIRSLANDQEDRLDNFRGHRFGISPIDDDCWLTEEEFSEALKNIGATIVEPKSDVNPNEN